MSRRQPSSASSRTSGAASNDAPDLKSPAYRRTRAAWERIWREEADSAREMQTIGYPRSKHTRSLFLPYLRPGDRVLEAGCGLGVELIALGSWSPRMVGVDYSLAALAGIRRGDARHRIAAADVHGLPFAGETFDALLSFGVLEHFDFGPGPALQEAWRVLRPQGLMILTVPYPNVVWRLVRLRRRIRPPRPEARAGYYETAYSASRLAQFVTQAGFGVVERHPIGHSYTLWGLGGRFRAPGYYRTSSLAEKLGASLRRLAPWAFCSASLWILRKADPLDRPQAAG
jgi:SAM-dependent methyltransferase